MAAVRRIADGGIGKRVRKMIKLFAKLTTPAAGLAAALALVLSPTVSLANTPAKKSVHQPTRQIIQFQSQESAADWDHDADGFYHPTRSPGWNGINH
jgi:hypothetical protein